ncbi:cell wall metabolism sensor histidine kinase WalK [Granulicatella elegans]|jgi:sensory box histidine kinase vicK|uniref:cell wall metabolism sensor histidine kinase WalK n=1 Tax=Granulicatella elegans TaxID=137732 RepID=UPI000F140439|nr:cell wall metabolism sensor histidine kinase WalK [Granulicatella elegans]RKW29108.1 MAG: cell wall metabolism sensor histidine kinase WalK [Granulicatella sp.]
MQKVKRFFRSIQFKIPVLFIFMLMISLQLIVANFLRQLETQMISNFQEQIQLQVGFLKNSVQPILERDDKDEVKITEISKILQDYPTGSSIVEARVLDTQGYILGTTNQSQQSVIGTRTTEADAQQVLLTNVVYTYNYTEHDTRYWKIVSPISSSSGNSGNPLGIISVTTNIESRYTQVKDIGVIFVSSSLIAIVLVIIITFLISQGITKPIAEMKKQTEKIAEGNYTGEVKIYSDDELGQLGQAINDLSFKIKEAQENSESERQRLDSVLRHMSDGVIATDRRGRIVIMNTAALDILNLKSEKVIGIPLLSILPLEEKVTFRELLETQHERLIHLEEDGEDSIVQCEFSVIQRESGFISGLVCVLTDVTEQQKIDRERRNFVSNVSHELRTPLTSIKSYTEALVDGAWENKEIAPGFLKVIETETDRMMRMITDLLNLSRMDQNRLALEKEFINMNELVVHIVNRFEMVLQSEPYRDKNYRILTDITQRDLWVELDQDKITQVLDNIINNAIKYSPDGGRIIVRLMETHTDIIVSVSDEGLGISRKDIPHLFDRFYRVDKARSRAMGGSGLGLAIAQEVIQLHGGKIWVNSIENKGSTFFVSLPYIPFEEDGEWE